MKDVVRANILAAKSGENGVFNIGSGASITIAELAGMVIDLLGKNLKPLHEKPREGDIKNSFSDTTKAQAFGYQAEYLLEEGLRRTVEWFEGNTGNV